MITYASTEGIKVMESLAAECRQIVLMARDEKKRAVLRIPSILLGLMVVFAVFVGLRCLGFQHVFDDPFEAWLMGTAISLAAGVIPTVVLQQMKGEAEISEYLYLKLLDMKSNYRDCWDINARQEPLSLRELELMMRKLLNALHEDATKPGRAEFLSSGKDVRRMFRFY